MHPFSTLPLRCARAASSNIVTNSMPAAKQGLAARFLCTKSGSITAAIQTTTTRPLQRIPTSPQSFRQFKPSIKPFTRTYATAAPSTPSEPLTWNRFLALRKTRRRFSLGSSIVCSIVTLGVGGSQILNSDADNTIAAAIGTDPMVVWGLSGVVLVAVGWLLGPVFGNGLFRLRYNKHRGAMDAKEREFFHRIKKHRSNPANSSLSNPIPDYYGEKIGSVAGYRRWLKDQRAFNLKRGEIP